VIKLSWREADLKLANFFLKNFFSYRYLLPELGIVKSKCNGIKKLTINSFSKFNGVKCKPLTAGKNLTALSVNGLKMISVH
jgi:hypothetical protein